MRVKEENYPTSVSSLEKLHELIKSKYRVKFRAARKVDSTSTITYKSPNKSERFLVTHMQFSAGKKICFKANGMAFALLKDFAYGLFGSHRYWTWPMASSDMGSTYFFCYPDEDESCAQFVPHIPCPN